jgi:acyl dehydratase
MTQTYFRTFESVALGDKISLIRGPLSSMHLMRWSAAMENWHRIHFDEPFTKGHEKLPGLLINGSLKQQFIMTMLKDWVGPSGWVWKSQFQFRAMNVCGETLTAWACVRAKREFTDYGVVDLDLGIVNGDNLESTPGSASIALPYQNGRALPYPFKPPKTV